MAAPVIIRVGCAIDTSVEKTFGDIERRAVRAGKAVEKAMRPGRRRVLDDGFVREAIAGERKVTVNADAEAKRREKIAQHEAKAKARAEQQAEKARIAAEKATTKEAEQEARKKLKAFQQEARARERAHAMVLAEIRDMDRAAERERDKDANRAEKRARLRSREEIKASRATERERRRSERDLDRFATRTSHRATRFFWPNAPLASMARRAGHDIMRGIGVDTTLSGAIGRGTQLQTASTALSTAGYLPGTTGPNASRVSSAALGGEARGIGTQFAMDPGAVIEAQDQFVKLTGDLDMSRRMMGSLAGLSIASGASLQDMATAAGEVSNAFGDMGSQEEKMKAIDQAMRSLAAQGKIGAVEMRDYARYMAHLGGTVGAFGGDRATRLAQFGAMTQLAKAYGGGTSAAVATRAVSGFRNILETPARRAKFREYGVAIEDQKGMLRDPFAIIRDALSKTGGKTEPLKEMFANVIGARAVSGLSNIYKQAGGGDAGMAAVNKEFERMMKADSMSKEAVAEAVAEYEKTTAAKAQRFQNNLDQIAETAAGKLIPALEKLAPQALKVADALSRAIQWATENPGKAITAAIVGSILRAGLESAARGAIDSVITGSGRAIGMGGMGPSLTTSAPVGAAAHYVPAAGLMAIGLGSAAYEYNALSGNLKGGANQVGANDMTVGSVANFLTGGVVGAAARKMGGGSWGESAGELSHVKAYGWIRDLVTGLGGGGNSADAQAKREATARQAEQARMAQATEAMRDKLGQTLNVRVTNADELRNPPPGGGGGDPDGREKPGA